MYLDRMAITGKSCASCARNTGTTNCDKCELPLCRDCMAIMVVTPSVSENLIQVMHYKCAPLSHRKKMDAIKEKHGKKKNKKEDK
jgi:hypothetical protein